MMIVLPPVARRAPEPSLAGIALRAGPARRIGLPVGQVDRVSLAIVPPAVEAVRL